jgi:Smr domain
MMPIQGVGSRPRSPNWRSLSDRSANRGRIGLPSANATVPSQLLGTLWLKLISLSEGLPQPDTRDLSPCCDLALGRTMAGMKLKLDLHDIYNRGGSIDRALRAIINETVATKAQLVEIIPGKGSGALKKRVLRFLEQKEIKSQYHWVE